MTRVLLVDDDRALVRALSINLKARGYHVDVALTGASALALASSGRPDVVVLDLGLPDLDGIEVLHGLRGWTRIPVLVLSAREDQTEKVAALDSGADDYVTKHFRLTPTEWHLLEVLVRSPGRLVGQKHLLHEVWGPAYQTESNYLRVYIAQLRRKLEPEPATPVHLITEPGLGYRFEP